MLLYRFMQYTVAIILFPQFHLDSRKSLRYKPCTISQYQHTFYVSFSSFDLRLLFSLPWGLVTGTFVFSNQQHTFQNNFDSTPHAFTAEYWIGSYNLFGLNRTGSTGNVGDGVLESVFCRTKSGPPFHIWFEPSWKVVMYNPIGYECGLCFTAIRYILYCRLKQFERMKQNHTFPKFYTVHLEHMLWHQ